MACDYDRLCGTERHALGGPTKQLDAFFETLSSKPLCILDAGCGQGRDTLHLARLGHSVVGVDLSPNGIRNLEHEASNEGLPIEGIVADIAHYAPSGLFDLILFDRTLHMLSEDRRVDVLRRYLDCVATDGWCVIADEAPNITGFLKALESHSTSWRVQKSPRSYLFARRS